MRRPQSRPARVELTCHIKKLASGSFPEPAPSSICHIA
jgi:hypothetical protein